MSTNLNPTPPASKTNCRSLKITTTYRGFTSIDQEIEREIALQWFSSKKSSFSQRNFLLKKDFL